jgi:bifunctional DNA-binding transcriptional regulator/antitoxin component of YhaV-PrlF toxin-antitoxin module
MKNAVAQTLLIGPKGQITLPKKIRNLFKSKAIILELIDDTHVMISPVPDVGGAISKYAKDVESSFAEIRHDSWLDLTRSRENEA